MAVTHAMGLQDAVYALVLDEIQCQPHLQDELGGNQLVQVALTAFGRGLQRVCEEVEMMKTGLPQPVITGPGFQVIRSPVPPPQSMIRNLAEVLAMPFGSNYEALCRSALLHLFWGQLDAAEKKVNLAKNNHDDRSFAHHVYGLLRGLQGNRDGARFELTLASARENYEGAKVRIGRALRLLA